MRLVAPLLALLASFPAFAAEAPETRLARMEVDIGTMEIRLADLDRQAAPGRGLIGTREAYARFEQYLYDFMLQDYDRAAVGFFGLVTTGALTEIGFHRDAEWYLAESLLEMGNYATAESRYLQIAADASHPFRQDAVQRLLELYSRSGEADKFREAYEREIVSGNIQPTDTISYGIARSFYLQNDLAQAKSHFRAIPATSPIYGRAQYFLGAIAVSEGDIGDPTLDTDGNLLSGTGSLAYFQQVIAQSVDSPEARQVQDLGLLAIGRIFYERGAQAAQAADLIVHQLVEQELAEHPIEDRLTDAYVQKIIENPAIDETKKAELARLKRLLDQSFFVSANYYARIGGDSEYLDDKLYELLWAYIQQGEYRQAQQASEIFLIGFPDHEYAAQIRLTEGHLLMKQGQKEEAFQAYETVVADYGPVQERFALLAVSPDESSAYFKRIAATQDGTAQTEDLPAFAISMMTADPDFAEALDVYRDVDGQWSDVEISETLLAEIAPLLAGDPDIGSYDRLRSAIDLMRADTLQARIDLLAVEEGALPRASASALRSRREQLAERVLSSGGPAWSDSAILGELEKLSGDYRSARAGGAAILGSRIDENARKLAGMAQKLDEISSRVEGIEQDELVRIRDQVAAQTLAVADQRREIEGIRQEAERVSSGLTSLQFNRLQAFFADSVLQADMGIVDVRWQTIRSIDERLKGLATEKTRLETAVIDRYDVIRQKLPAESAGGEK